MKTILKTNDPVLLNYAEALLKDAGIAAVVFDESMSIMDGSIGVLPRRLSVSDSDEERAREILRDGVGAAELEPQGK
jgi:hypothetical protein